MKRKAYEIVVDQIIKTIENNPSLQWKNPWSNGFPRNFVSKKPYRGFNFLVLTYIALLREYKHPYWLTFKQTKDLGGAVKKGEKGTHIVFWKWLEIENEEGEIEKKIPFLRYYTVFNISQTTLKPPSTFQFTQKELNRIAIRNASRIVKNAKSKPQIKSSAKTYYDGASDVVHITPVFYTETEIEWWASLFHEMIHSTGTHKRLNRKSFYDYDKNEYSRAFEEMVAEIGANMLLALCGFKHEEFIKTQGAGYVNSWVRNFPQKKKAIILAATQAQKAVDFIVGNTALITAEDIINEKEKIAA